MTEKSSLIAFTPSAIPAALRANSRWAPWQAIWSERRRKWDKIPKSAKNTNWGLSTAHPQHWFSFDRALGSHEASCGATAGVGYVMTEPHGIVGVDLDGCLSSDGSVAPWAQEVLDRLGGYAERSPSGTGFRIFVQDEIPSDWTNHDVGIECYAGHCPRFLTVTGARLAGSAADVPPAPAGSLDWLATTYMVAPRTGDVDVSEHPEVMLEDELPDLDLLDLSFAARDMLIDGDFGSKDRSSVIFATSVELFRAGLSEQQVFSLLANNDHVMQAAMDKRQQKHEKALTFLWVHQTLKAKARLLSSSATVCDFDDLTLAYQEDLDEELSACVEEKAPSKKGVEISDEAWLREMLGEEEPPTDAADAENITDTAIPASAEPQESGDASDFADMGDAPPVEGVNVVTPPKKMRFAPVQAALYAKTRRQRDWFIYGLLPKADLVSVIGDSGAGKSFWVIDVVARIAEGREWCGKKVRKGKVIYVAAEGAGGVADRLTAYAEYQGIDLANLDLHIIGDQPNLLEKTDVKDLVVAIQTLGKADLIVIDTLAQVTPGASENSSEDMGRALAHCKTLKKYTGATILLVGHTGKDASKGLRGWSGLRGAMDAMIEVVRTDDYRCATVTKQKDGKGEGMEYLFNLAEVDLQDDEFEKEYGEKLTSCALLHLSGEEAAQLQAANSSASNSKSATQLAKSGRPPVNQEIIVELAANISDSGGNVKHLQLENAWLDYCEGQGMHMTTKEGAPKDMRRARLKEALDGALRRGVLIVQEDGRYLLTAPAPDEGGGAEDDWSGIL